MPYAPFAVRATILACLGLLLGGCGGNALTGSRPLSLGPGQPFAIYDVSAGRFVDLRTLATSLAPADVVFFGEFHDNAVTHRLELALFRLLGEQRERVALGLEMFERDVQPALEEYRAGGISREEFRRLARPWANYDSDYEPLVALAIDKGWPVVGTNLPQALASTIARGGLAALDTLPSADRRLAAAEIQCPLGEYWERFIDAIVENADSAGHTAETVHDPMFQSMFEAQCARDEAMAETVATVADPSLLVFHINGAFHSDFHLGIVPRLLRRRPELTIRVVSAIPVADVSRPELSKHLDRADYLIFTPE